MSICPYTAPVSEDSFPWPWVPEAERHRGLLAYHLNSGSSGNCTLYSDGRTHVLIDLGLSLRQVRLRLKPVGLTPADIHGLFLTHLHADHCTPAVADMPFPVFLQPAQQQALPHPMVAAPLCTHNDRWITAETHTEIGSLRVTSFEVSHDAPGNTVGFQITAAGPHGPTVFYCTDTGLVTPAMSHAMSQSHFVALESNHSPRLLLRTRRPPHLIRRILGPRGHLSNAQAAGALRACLQNGHRPVGLMALHLSGEANHPQVVDNMLRGLTRGHDTSVYTAHRNRPHPPLWITPHQIFCEDTVAEIPAPVFTASGRVALPFPVLR